VNWKVYFDGVLGSGTLHAKLASQTNGYQKTFSYTDIDFIFQDLLIRPEPKNSGINPEISIPKAESEFVFADHACAGDNMITIRWTYNLFTNPTGYTWTSSNNFADQGDYDALIAELSGQKGSEVLFSNTHFKLFETYKITGAYSTLTFQQEINSNMLNKYLNLNDSSCHCPITYAFRDDPNECRDANFPPATIGKSKNSTHLVIDFKISDEEAQWPFPKYTWMVSSISGIIGAAL